MSRKFYLVLIVVMTLTLLTQLGACAKSDSEAIKDTVASFWYAYDRGELGDCLEHFSSRVRTEEGDSSLLARLSAARALSGGVNIKSMSEPIIIGSTATIQVDTVFDNTGLVLTKHSLIREDDKWNIAEY